MCHYVDTFMISVTNKPFMLSVTLLTAIKLNVIMLNIIMPTVIMLTCHYADLSLS